MAVGVARIRAHGQEMTRIVMVWFTLRVKNQTMAAIIRIVGTYQRMYRSMIRMIGILVCSAWTIRDWTLPRVVSLPALVTRTSNTPVRLFVPAKTCMPGTLSTGRDSPVMVASFTELRPLATSPSAGTLSPGRTRIRSPGLSALTWTSVSRPAPSTKFALVGVSRIRASMDALAPSAVRVSTNWLRSMKNPISPAAA